jgi:hypothetical protein
MGLGPHLHGPYHFLWLNNNQNKGKQMKLHMLLGALALCAAFDAGATMIHDYELNGSLTDTLGGASLTAHGGTLDASGYRFGYNQGLALQSTSSPSAAGWAA